MNKHIRKFYVSKILPNKKDYLKIIVKNIRRNKDWTHYIYASQVMTFRKVG